MAIFLTGSTGYIGAHIASILLERHPDRLNLLVRAKTEQEARRAALARAAIAPGFSAIPRCAGNAHFHFSRRPHRSAFRSGRRRICAPGRNDRIGDSLRRVAQSQIRKKLPQREPARHAGSRATGAPRPGRARAAPLQPGLHRGRGGHIAATKSSPKTLRSTGTAPTTIPTRARKNSASTWCANCFPMFSAPCFVPSIVLGDSRRAETTQFDMVRAFVFLAGLPRAAVSLDRPDRHRARGLRRGIRRHAASKAESGARDLPPLFGHGDRKRSAS